MLPDLPGAVSKIGSLINPFISSFSDNYASTEGNFFDPAFTNRAGINRWEDTWCQKPVQVCLPEKTCQSLNIEDKNCRNICP